jgi:hypothetical protein
MILYITLGTNDLERSMRFYDPVMTTLGFARHYTDESEIGYGPVPPLRHRANALSGSQNPI